MDTFVVGRTYTTRSVGDHNCIISVRVDKRTAKTITATVGGATLTFRVGEYHGQEYIRPWGKYSMAPIIRATGD